MKPNELDAFIDDCLEGRLSEADAARLSAALQESPEARTRYWESASIHGLLEHTMQQESLRVITRQAAPLPPKFNRWLQWRPLAAAAAGIVFGMFCTSVVWAGVALFRRGPEPVAVALANADFDTFGEMKVGGFPKEGGYWRGDACAVVSEASGIRPRSGAGMLQFLHSDGKTDGVGRQLYASDQWQLVDLTKYRASMREGDGVVAELEAWFNSTATKSEEREAFSIELFAIRATSVSELNAISSFWLRQSNVVVASGTRRLVVDTDPATWERVSLDLPVPAEAKYLLVHLSAMARPGAAVGKLFPGEFADSVSLKLRPQVREAEHMAAR